MLETLSCKMNNHQFEQNVLVKSWNGASEQRPKQRGKETERKKYRQMKVGKTKETEHKIKGRRTKIRLQEL